MNGIFEVIGEQIPLWNQFRGNINFKMKSKIELLSLMFMEQPFTTLWNGLPEEIRQLNSLLAFKKAIKTELFWQAYPVEF